MPNLSDWMSHLPDAAMLNTCVLPATHDSGMCFSYLRSGALHPLQLLAKPLTGLAAQLNDLANPRKIKFSHDNFTTQIYGVQGQLQFGARQFDLRITSHNGTYRAYHGGYLQKLLAGQRKYGEKWADICSAISIFMHANQSEFLILKLDKQKTYTTKMMKMLNDSLRANYNPARNIPYTLPRRWLDQNIIGDLRGRVLVCGKGGALRDWRAIPNKHRSLTICEWRKDPSGANPNLAAPNPSQNAGPTSPDNPPIYLLLGSSEGDMTGMLEKKASPLRKQSTMKTKFPRNRTVGMRGIWFNTFSWVRDIRVYSDEVWDPRYRKARDFLWLNGPARQNVAGLDFLNQAKAEYVIRKNQHRSQVTNNPMANENWT